MSITKVDTKKLKKLGEYIKKIRNERKLGTNQLASKIDISPSYITRLEKGEIATVHPYLLKSVAKGLRIDYKELYKIVEYLEEEDFSTNIIQLEDPMSSIKVPLFESISAGCGIKDGGVIDYIIIPGLKDPQLHVAIKIIDDSMESKIPKGSIVLIKKDENIQDGEIGVFIIDSRAVIRRIRRNENENVLLSDNDKCLPIVIRKGDFYHEYGKVVKVLLDL